MRYDMTDLSVSERSLHDAFRGISIQKIQNALEAAEGNVEEAADLLLTEEGLAWSEITANQSSDTFSYQKTQQATSIKTETHKKPANPVGPRKSPQPILAPPRPKLILRTQKPKNITTRKIGRLMVAHADPDTLVQEKSSSANSMFARSLRTPSRRPRPALENFPKVLEAPVTPPLIGDIAGPAATQFDRAAAKIEEERDAFSSLLTPVTPSSSTDAAIKQSQVPTTPQELLQADSHTPKSISSNSFASQNSTRESTAIPVSISPTTFHSFSESSTPAPTEVDKGKPSKWDANSKAKLIGNHPMKDVLSGVGVNNIGEGSKFSTTDCSTSSTLSSLESSLDRGFDSLEFIMSIFPAADQEECQDALSKCDGDCARALEIIENNRPKDLLGDSFVEAAAPKQKIGKTAKPEQSTLTLPVGDNKTARKLERSEGSGVSLGDGSSYTSREDSRDADLREARRQKRKAEPEKEVSAKRHRRNSPPPDLEIARVWVNTNYGHNETGVSIEYHRDDELHTHRCRFPLAIISKSFPKLKVTHVKGSPRITLAEGISCDIFNLALQWSVCKNIRIESGRYPKESQQIELILCAVHFAENSGLQGFSVDMVNHIRPLLIKNRSALDPLFINAAQTLPPKHPLQKLFVKATMKSYFEHREDPNRRDIGAIKTSHDNYHYRDEAHRIAFEGNIWKFDSCLKKHPRFELAVMRMAREMWWKREVTKTPGGVKAGGGKVMTVVYDPLDGSKLII